MSIEITCHGFRSTNLSHVYLHIPDSNLKNVTSLNDPTRRIVVIRVKFFQTKLMVEIGYECLVGAIGKVLLMTFS